jgi:RNA polymerase sigma-70 factor, ECF subfamily
MTSENRRRRFFQEEVDRLTDCLYGTALRLTRDSTQAEDLVADAVVKAWAKFDTLEDLQSFEKWIFRILFNTFISGRRRRREVPMSDLSPDDEDDDGNVSLFEKLHQPFLLWWGNPEQQLLSKLLRQDIESALDTLPDAFRILMVMIEIQGFTYSETAETLNIPVGTVRSRLSRARSLLQNALWQQARQYGIRET